MNTAVSCLNTNWNFTAKSRDSRVFHSKCVAQVIFSRQLPRRLDRQWRMRNRFSALSPDPNLCWACALGSLVTFLTGDHVMQIGFGQMSPSASSSRDLGARLSRGKQKRPLKFTVVKHVAFCFLVKVNLNTANHLNIVGDHSDIID